MVPLSTAVSSQIRLLVDSLHDSNFDSICRELCELADCEPEGGVLLLKGCFEQVKLTGGGDAQNAQHKRDLFSNIFRHLLGTSYFSANFCEALKTVPTNEHFLLDLSTAFKLSGREKSDVGLALLDSDDLDLRLRGHNFILAQIDELCENPSLATSNAHIQEIAVFILQNKELSKHTDSFEKILSYLQLNESPFTVPCLNPKNEIYPVAPLRTWNHYFSTSDEDLDAYLAEIEKETSSPDMITEFGYGCTASMDHCKFVLSLFQPLNDAMVAKLVGAMTRTRTGLDDSNGIYATFLSAVGCSLTGDSNSLSTWDVGIFVGSVKQVAPSTDWKNVMENLDHEGFIVPDEAAFNFLMSLYSRACQELLIPFSIRIEFSSQWTKGQLSFLKYAATASSDVFTFAHCTHQLAFSEVAYLKQGNQAWFCLDLIQVLCQLAEQGHAMAVRGILSFPIDHCPGVLLLGVSQINTAYNLIQNEVVSCTIPMVLKDPTKTSIIGCLWRVNPQLVIKGFIEANKDMSYLIRIVTVCSELKILAAVLDGVPFSFSIRLVSVAGPKEQNILEKWLTENLEKHKEAFCEECIKFLQEAFAEVSDGANSTQAVVAFSYKEMLATFLKLLQSHSGPLMSEQLVEEINKVMSSLPLSSSRGSSEGSAEQPGATEDVDAEANTYFHQMFSGQLTIEQMVQMLTRFKESSDQREQMIFNCMIANLFEEYKFFPKYPDKQLKLAAVLFGSLIKHQLVTHLALGIALRGVLDALRKSVDSKMFIFGTKALEQFMDRLVEWPQYCNHILQISHLRGTHPELVAVIERTLARVSSSQNEPNNGGTSLPFEQHGSGPTSIENMETSEASWQLVGATPSQLGRQVSSFQMPQQRLPPQGFLGERMKPSTPMPTNQAKSVISAISQTAVSFTPNDSAPNVPKPSVTPSLLAPSHSSGASSAGSAGAIRTRNLATTGVLRQSSYSTGFGAALNIETLVAAAERRDTPIETPLTEVQDKILFIVNNISTSNMEAKAKEFNEVLQEQYFPWFAQYMVMKRASIEPNFHDLYLKFLDKVNSKALNKEILKATYENCKVLLRSDLIKSSSEERSLLKNLGSWLGKFTIGRNQALRAKEIDPKSLIIEAYERGLMIAVIPFTSKILEPCQSSIAYRPPNPWTMGIMSLLAEIYNLPNLKMNLRFDIEVLFKNLGVDVKEVKPSSLIKDRVREVEGNPDFSNKDITTVSQPPIVAEASIPVPGNHVELPPEVSSIPGRANLPTIANQYAEPAHHAVVPAHAAGPAHYAAGPGHHSAGSRYAGPVHLAHGALEEDKVGPLVMPEQVPSPHGIPQVVTPAPPSPSPSPFSLNQLLQAIPRADTYFRINPKLSAVGGSQVPYSRLIEAAMDKSVKEIISPVIQRSVTIASRTTKELILKDYAVEPDDGVIFRAAHLMVGTLAGSLAHVTCKEPLRNALTSNLRTMLQALNSNNDNNEQIVQILITDHLDLGCALIESVATRKAVEIIDADIGQALAQLRKQREAAGSAYYDAFTFAQGSYAHVPDALRPKPGQLSNAQLRVYEDFVNVWQTQGSQNSSAASGSQATGTSGTGSTVANTSVAPRAYSPSPSQMSAGAYPTSAQTTGFAPQPLDMPSDELDHIPSQIPNIVTSEAVSNAAAQFTARVGSPDLPVTESAPATKDLGLVVPPSPTPVVDRLGTITPEPLSTGDVLERYQQVSQKLEALIAKDGRDVEIQAFVSEVPDIILRCVSRDEAALAVAQKVFRSLYENVSNGLHVASYLAILVAIRDVSKLVVKELTSWVIYSDEEKKFNVDTTIGLIRSELLNLGEFNLHLAKLIDGGRNKAATEFAIALVQTLVTQESGVFISELFNVVDTLSKIASRPGSPESLQHLIEIVRNITAPSKDEKARQLRDKKVLSSRPVGTKEEGTSSEITAQSPDPAGFQDQVAVLFSDWCQLCDLPVVNDVTYSHYISQLQQHGLLKGDDTTDRFFRVLTEMSVAHSLVKEPGAPGAVQNQTNEQISFFPIDSYARLAVVILKYASVDQVPNKALLLMKVLSVTAKVIVKDAEEKKTDFNARPYFRLFINWLLDIVSPDLDGANYQVLTCFASTFLTIQPLRVPSFSFAWLELLCHKNFMPKILTCNSPKGWPHFQRLLVCLFKFVEPFLRKSQLPEPVVLLYKGILKMMLVLLHDFPEFLCDYHFSLCDVIPATCIQLRNLILSGFPRNMRLPDPSTPNLKIDLLPEILQAPRILSDVEGALKVKQIKGDIDEYLKTRPEGSPFLAELRQKLLLPQSEVSQAGTRYNVPLINSLVLYIGMQAIQQLQSKNTSAQQMTHSPMDIFLVGAAMDIYQSLVKNLDTEGRYYLVNAICNQLRYPNNHTHYFSFVLLYLWAEASSDLIQEQITRVLLERLIVNRPHPWGLLITFIEMIKNPRYNFWNRPFTHVAPDIEKLFESVSRSCGAGSITKALEDAHSSAGVTDVNH
ncbi:transcription regulator [Rhynchospora pubera]|uniref:Transcription regulator n=1 Tax=Rhynchospora pubera TaxID=906938 RepID=A0AAV8FQN4_9POAL|nr:transcription regulator [Rhynchospora pubera]